MTSMKLTIYNAVMHGDSPTLRRLLSQDPLAVYEGHLLHLIVCMGQHHMIKIALSYGADINELDDKGNTPLYIASMYNRFHCVRILLGAGATIDTPCEEGDTTLEVAYTFSCDETLALLVKHWTDRQKVMELHIDTLLNYKTRLALSV